MNETDVLLNVLNSLKVLMSKQDLMNCKDTAVKRTLVIIIKCIFADKKLLSSLIIWFTFTHQSIWTMYLTFEWHFTCSKTEYIDIQISLYWIQHMFNPLMRAQVNHKPQILINNRFKMHESLNLMRFCY